MVRVAGACPLLTSLLTSPSLTSRLAKSGHNRTLKSCCLLDSLFSFAFDLARLACKEKIPEVHLKHAMHLEDQVNPLVL